MVLMTQNISVKHTYSDREIIDLSRKMAGAESRIREKQDALKSVTTTIKAEIAEQEALKHSCAEKLRSGYEMRTKECAVSYESGVARFTDKDTGEVMEERPITEEEQLKLSGKWVDAEQVIREDNENS